ncbi:neogenin-like isoform X4 [Lineus longissimus]|uniref:neogenin-like isoform X4 n=1 Tax=Lineus longissimus TaxID=88925 RepID=UPI00315DAC60
MCTHRTRRKMDILLVSYFLLGLLITVSGTPVFSAFTFTIEPNNTVVDKGRAAMLNCAAKHTTQTPDIQWIRDGEFMNFDADTRRHKLQNGSLYFETIVHTRGNRPDEGVYQCVASVNGLGSIISRSATLQISYLSAFTAEPADLVMHLGDTAMIPCFVDAVPAAEISWLKEEMELTEEENINIRIHKEGVLEILNIRFQDFGNYKCQAKNSERIRTSRFAALRQNPDVASYQGVNPLFVMSPRDKTVLVGSTVKLFCGANGRDRQGQLPTITWLKDGATIDMSHLDSRFRIVGQGSLQIDGVTLADAGAYTCRARNLEESTDTDAILTVNEPPKFIRSPQNTFAQVNKDIQFDCEVSGNPKPTIQWIKNGDIIIPNDYFQIIDSQSLRILGLVNSDEGIYQCVAENSAGNVQASAQLIIVQQDTSQPTQPTLTTENNVGDTKAKTEDLPSGPMDLKPVIVSTRFVTLTWKIPQRTGPTEIIAYSVYWKEQRSARERVLNTTSPEANIQHLKPATKYEFRVLAYNRLGPGTAFANTQLETQPEVHVPGAVANVRVVVESPRSIRVDWDEPIDTKGGAITHYKLYYYEVNAKEEKDIDVTGTGYTLTNLKTFTRYNVRIVAYNSNGRGMSTEDYAAKTYSAEPSDTPMNVTLETASSMSVIVRWEPPPKEFQNGVITGYKIKFKKAKSGRTKSATTDGNRRLYVLTELDRGTKYHIKIAAINVNGSGPATDWKAATTFSTDRDETKVPGQPSSLRVRPFTNSIVVSWTPPHNSDIQVRGYTLGYGIGIPDVYSQVLDAKQRLYTIEDLKPASEYVISLRAFNKVGDGRPIYETVITREETTPEPATPMIPPVGLRAIVLSPNTILVTWSDTTLGRNQHITDNRYYTVRYTPVNTRKFRYVNSTDLNAHIDDLRPNQQYEFMVKVIKGRRKSTWSLSVVNATFEDAPFSAPRDLTPIGIDDMPLAVTLNWQPPRLPNGQITEDVTGYLVFYTIDATRKDREWAVAGVLGDKLSTTIRDLNPDTTYYFKIQARNSKGYGPMSPTVVFQTEKGSASTGGDNKSPNILWIIIACVIGVTVIAIFAIVAVIIKRRQSTRGGPRKSGYKPSSKTKGKMIPQKDVKPPDLWIHHEQMELKSIDKGNGDPSMTVTPIPRNSQDINCGDSTLEKRRNSFVSEYSTHSTGDSSYDRRQSQDRHGHRSDDDDRYRRPVPRKPITFPVDQHPREPIATATAIPNGHIIDSGGSLLSSTTMPVRPMYPRTQYSAQYNNPPPRVHAGDISQPSSDECCTFDRRSLQRHMSRDSLRSGPVSPESPCPYNQQAPIPYDQLTNHSGSNSSTPTESTKSLPHRPGHPLKSFSVPGPPNGSAPGTPTPKHIVKPTQATSPYKKTVPTSSGQSGPMKSRSPLPVISPRAPDAAIKSHHKKGEDLPRSSSTEELSAEMANLEGIMKDLNAITQSEFEC